MATMSIILAVNYKVYDVTKGKHFYGKGEQLLPLLPAGSSSVNSLMCLDLFRTGPGMTTPLPARNRPHLMIDCLIRRKITLSVYVN